MPNPIFCATGNCGLSVGMVSFLREWITFILFLLMMFFSSLNLPYYVQLLLLIKNVPNTRNNLKRNQLVKSLVK